MNGYRLAAILISVLLAVSVPSGCSSKAVAAAKQIESDIQEQQARIKSFSNIKAESIDAQYAMDIIKELTSVKYKGRKTGTKENEAALEYIAQQFRAIGLESPKGLENYRYEYYQPLTLLKETPRLSLMDREGNLAKEYKYPKNFVFKMLSDSTQNINIQAPMQVINNTQELNGRSFDKQEVLLFSLGAIGRYSLSDLVDKVYNTNVSAVIIEDHVGNERDIYSDLVVSSLNSLAFENKNMPVIYVDSVTYSELAEAASENKTIDIRCSYSFEKRFKASNVIGYIPGIDEKLKNQYIIIGGHMDAQGDNLNGTYNPGALDNASGTAAMLEIARVIAAGETKPKKTLVFIAFNGEEQGLQGSRSYAADPVFSLKDAVMINLDMVGSSAMLPISAIAVPGHPSDLKPEFFELGKTLGIEMLRSDTAGSDQIPFEEKGVPSVLLTHMDLRHGYHSPNDTLEDIDKGHLKQVIELVLHYLDKKAY